MVSEAGGRKTCRTVSSHDASSVGTLLSAVIVDANCEFDPVGHDFVQVEVGG